jgi:hypothetical protein
MTLICSGKEDVMQEAWESSIHFLEKNTDYIDKNEKLIKRLLEITSKISPSRKEHI